MKFRTPSFWYKPHGGAFLAPLGHVYGWAGRARFALTRPERVGMPVICVGNLVAGGAGKTPVALSLTDRLRTQGHAPHILTRGYGGKLKGPVLVDSLRHVHADVGDEALLLAEHAPTWVGRNRAVTAHAAISLGADILVMDDGFQNPGLIKDLSLVVVDGRTGLGNGRLIPAGPLREKPEHGFARADAFVLMGDDLCGVSTRLQDSGKPLLSARVTPIPSIPMTGRRVVAFAGIGRPEKFFMACETLRAHVLETWPFPDHYPYTTRDLVKLAQRAEELGAVLATTAKDAVRLPRTFRKNISVVDLAVSWQDTEVLDRLLAPLFTDNPLH